jgi:hypothetical protein
MLAKNDDRRSFNELLNQVNTKGPFHEVAMSAIEQIIQEVDPLLQVRLDADVPWQTTGVSIEKSSFAELQLAYKALRPMHRPKFLSQLWEQGRFNKGEKLSFLAEVLKEENSLRALHRACVLINFEAQLNKNILGVPDYLKWWGENQHKFSS